MQTPYVTYNNEIGVRLSYLLSDEDKKRSESIAVWSYSCYEKKVQRNNAIRLRQGKGKGSEVLIRWVNLSEYHDVLIEKFGNPELVHNPLVNHFAIDGMARLFFETEKNVDGTNYLPAQISQYTLNASVLNALGSMYKARKMERKARGNSPKNTWISCVNDCNAFNNYLKSQYNGAQHTLPKNHRRLADALRQYSIESYAYLLDKRAKNQNAAKVKTEVHLAMIEQLLRKHNNYDNEQIAEFYNIAAEQLQWATITASTVANYRKELGLYISADSMGATKFRNTKSMQVKRSAPTVSMAYWTLDGWDAELLYQREGLNKDGKKVTTYHNRLTVVVVMDPVAGIKYPIGYAIGTHETPELIQEAMRNAANHTQELFGSRHKPLQLQSDHYAIKTLTPLYEAMTKHFTPARVQNAKSKTIEPYFLHLNKQAQKYFSNWSGFGITSRKENQPNTDYLNKIRHSFPNEQGCREQITRLIEMERSNKVNEYVQRWEMLPEADRLPLPTAEYLYLFGNTHTHTNKLNAQGLTPTIMGRALVFDVFDPQFRALAYEDWAIKYDPTDLSQVLVLNAKTDASTREVKEVIGTHRFMLQAKYLQPMALYDRKDGDAEQLHKVFDYNKQLEQTIITRREKNMETLETLFTENPQLNDTLAKMVLTDSNGQHKDNRNTQRAIPKKQTIHIPQAPQSNDDYEIIEDDVRDQY